MKRIRLSDVLDSCSRVVERARSVSVDRDRVRSYGRTLAQAPIDAPEETDLLFRGTREDCANFVLLADALNFCFWSDEPWEVPYRGRTWTRTYAMLAGLLRAIESDRRWLEPGHWRSATSADVESMFGGIPLPARRLEIMRETGHVLGEAFGGRFATLVDGVAGDAERITDALSEHFPSFRDDARYGDIHAVFLKRAQIATADLHRTWLANGHGGLANMHALTVFADYRLPQLFRHSGLLRLSPDLAARVDRRELIEAGSPEEVEIRAATVWIGELLRQEIAGCGHAAPAWELDYVLWCRARDPEVTVEHHRTVTHFY